MREGQQIPLPIGSLNMKRGPVVLFTTLTAMACMHDLTTQTLKTRTLGFEGETKRHGAVTDVLWLCWSLGCSGWQAETWFSQRQQWPPKQTISVAES